MIIQIRINERVYLKDPASTDLGRRIIQDGICLIDELGFESFTFKKLAAKVGSTEASIYRYFENKHKLLIYLVSWYWNWLEYQLMLNMHNISSARERLRIALHTLSEPVKPDSNFIHIDEVALHRIVIAESSKAYLTKEVDADNREGYFASYKRLCKQIAHVVREINPGYPFPAALISTAIESAHNQKYFSEHLPSLTEVKNGDQEELTSFLTDLVFRVLDKK